MLEGHVRAPLKEISGRDDADQDQNHSHGGELQPLFVFGVHGHWYNMPRLGGVAERFNAPVLKTGEGSRPP